MDKINPLTRIPGLSEEHGGEKHQTNRTSASDQTFSLDRVEISRKARLVQRAENLQKSISNELIEDSRRIGEQWYLYGYTSTGLE